MIVNRLIFETLLLLELEFVEDCSLKKETKNYIHPYIWQGMKKNVYDWANLLLSLPIVSQQHLQQTCCVIVRGKWSHVRITPLSH